MRKLTDLEIDNISVVSDPLPGMEFKGGLLPYCTFCGAMTEPRIPCSLPRCPHRPLGEQRP